jgi:hypothetical protein
MLKSEPGSIELVWGDCSIGVSTTLAGLVTTYASKGRVSVGIHFFPRQEFRCFGMHPDPYDPWALRSWGLGPLLLVSVMR